MPLVTRMVMVVVLSTFWMGVAVAQTKPGTKAVPETTQVVPIKTAGAQYGNEGVVVEDIETHYTYQDDGTGTLIQHLRVKVQDEAGAKVFSVVSVAYASATQKAQMLDVTVTHPDGTKVVTPPSDDIDMPAQVTQEAPLYSDLKLLQAPVRGLRPGDVLNYTMRVDMEKAQAPGEFWGDSTFLKKVVVLKGVLTLDVPADKPVQVWGDGLTPLVKVADGRKVYTWNYTQPKPTQGLAKKATATEVKPSVAWTTFSDWNAVGAWYRGLAAPRMAPSPAIVAKANEITENAKTPEAEARAIYDFVSTHIRYIGVDFGIGRYQPHSAETVLANQYGDCKDKDTLLEALLRAKGFETAPALIGAGVKMIPDLPSPGLFNHVITTVTIGGKQVWLDSTPEVAPFQMLISVLRKKQALVIPANGTAKLEQTPARAPFPLKDSMDATATLTADGDLKAHMVIEDRSDTELLLRAVARNAAPAQWDQAVQYLSRLMGFGGTVSNAEFEHVENLNVPIRLTYDYEHPKFGDWSDLRILPLFPLTGLPAAPDKKPEKAIDLGAERTEMAQTVIHLPAKFTPDLPDAVHVKTDFATYDLTYSYAKGALTADRTVVVLQSKVPAKDWNDYVKFVNDASLFNYTYIQLLTNGKGSGAGGTSAASSGETARQLIAQADALERANDLAGALKLLDKVKAEAPKQPYLWSNYGWVAMRQNKLPEALKDYAQELKYHPDEVYVSWLYASALAANGQRDEAIGVLKPLLVKHPEESGAALLLASLEERTDLPGAIAVLQSALAAKPENGSLSSELADLLIRNHESDKAAPLLEKALAKAKDAVTLNDESYELALTGQDLPLAEQKERQALGELEGQTSQLEVAGANQQAFARASLLAADWDTLGYILMQEGKLKEGSQYLEAAWNNRQDPVVGLHYGMVLEKQDERAKALRIYELSLGQETDETAAQQKFERYKGIKVVSSPMSEDEKQLKAAVARLKKEHVRSTGEDATIALQRMRTFHLIAVAAPKKFEQATFRLEFAADGPPQVMQVNGDARMAQFVKKIEAVHFPEMVPPGSKARLVRDAAMSCSPGDRHCVLVLMPMGGMQAENTSIQNQADSQSGFQGGRN